MVTATQSKEIEEKLRKAGVQPTAQRIAICHYVLHVADHPSAEQVKGWLDLHFPMVSLATVYNTLKRLVEAGLLLELKLPHSDVILFDSNTHAHHHFLDEESGELIDLDSNEVEVLVRSEAIDVSSVQVLVRGKRRQ